MRLNVATLAKHGYRVEINRKDYPHTGTDSDIESIDIHPSNPSPTLLNGIVNTIREAFPRLERELVADMLYPVLEQVQSMEIIRICAEE